MSNELNKIFTSDNISVRHDIFYYFSTDAVNVENKEKKPVFSSPFS